MSFFTVFAKDTIGMYEGRADKMTLETHVGDARVLQVTEVGYWPFPPTDLFAAMTEAQHRDGRARLDPACFDQRSGELVLAINTYVIRLGATTILVDAGNGNGKQRPNLLAHHMFETDYMRRLEAAGVAPHQVDLVISTHLHPDHCGWSTSWNGRQWVPTFPNATHLFVERELEHLRALAEKAPPDGVEADLARSYQDSVRPVIDSGRWRYVEDADVIAASGATRIVVRSAPGHTNGHIVVEIEAPRDGAVFCGDVIHHPIQLLYPELVQNGDSDPVTARTSRETLLRRCAAEGLRLFTAHFPIEQPLDVGLDDADARSRRRR